MHTQRRPKFLLTPFYAFYAMGKAAIAPTYAADPSGKKLTIVVTGANIGCGFQAW